MRFWRIVLILVVAVGTATARPAKVILLRHGEKVPDEMDENLSERGQMRAEALASCLTTNSSFLSNGLPVALFAPKITRHDNVRRPYETLKPLARSLKLAIQMPCDRKDYRGLVSSIMKDPAYDGKTVVVCWVHDYLPAMAREFGIKSKSLTWKGSVYDRFWVITFHRDHAKLTSLPQHLLPEDSAD